MTLQLDGSEGEGGGQIVRTALTLSLVTGEAFEIDRVRAKRKRPGLLRQHLTAIEAAAEIGRAEVSGARLRSTRFRFAPDGLRPGEYRFDIGTAGSATLVAQTVIPALLAADGPAEVTVRGGTHNPFAPPFGYFEMVYLPALRRLGGEVSARLVRHGFYPAGGGEIRIATAPSELRPATWLERGRIRRRAARATVANLPRHVAERELAIVAKRLGWKKSEMEIEEAAADGPGNVLELGVEAAGGAELATGFGEAGLPAERVAERACRELSRYVKAKIPVGEHLADQILVPLALAGGGSFVTTALTSHATTNAATIEQFLPVRIGVADEGEGIRRVTIE
jgi:RNA 3'-terminal phosphate cyclase (ATP)